MLVLLEQILRTSAWAGDDFELPVKGYSGKALVRIGVHIFDQLADRGFARLSSPEFQTRSAVEVFPNASWYAFGACDETLDALQLAWPARNWGFEGDSSEHDLDAAVGGFSAIAAAQGHACFVGEPAIQDTDGLWREGFIVLPDPSRPWRRKEDQ